MKKNDKLDKNSTQNLPKGDVLSLPKGDALSLPKGWKLKKLGQLCEVLDKLRKPITKRDRVPGKYPYYGATGILDYIDDYIFDERLILIGEDGAKWNSGDRSSFIVEGKYWVNNHAHVIKPDRDRVVDDWIVYFFNFSDLSEYITGLTVPKLNQTKLRSIEIPLPPLPEQQRIVGKLDKLFAGIEALETNTKQNLENARELFQSYLQRVFDPSTHRDDDCGTLSSSKWEERTLKEVTSKIGSGATPRGGKASYKEKGISLIRSMNVHDFEFKEKKLAFIDEQQAEALSNVELQEKDVLMNITGASIARCCIVPNQYLPARVNQHVSIIRAKQNLVSPLFLASLLTSKPYKDQILETGGQGATRQAITKVQLESFKITIPKTVEEQQRIVEKLDALSTETKKLESICQEKLLSLSELKKSILDRAFKGKLL